jgi:hypothetical protein
MTTSLQTHAYLEHAEELRKERRKSLIIGAALGLLPLAVFQIPFVHNNVLIGDDRQLGRVMHDVGANSGSPSKAFNCANVAVKIYGHGIAGLHESGEGWAPRAEKAFYIGCTGHAMGD